MVITRTTEACGEITYAENSWTGAKKISVNGAACVKQGKNRFLLPDGNGYILIKGSSLTGAVLTVMDNNGKTLYEEKVIPSPKWYEWVIAVIPFAVSILFGNIPSLFQLFPVVGGAIGGLIGALSFAAVFAVFRKVRSTPVKFIVAVLIDVGFLFILNAIALAMIAAIS